MKEYTEDRLKHITRSHWEEYCPKMWARMTEDGTAQDQVEKAVQGTLVGMKQIIGAGYTEDQAWEMMREDWILLKEEQEEDEEEIESPLYDIMVGLQRINEELIAGKERRD